MFELIALIALFIVLSGLFAMVDTAILSVSHGEVEELVTQKKHGALALRSVTRDITRSVIVVVIFTNTINILGPILIGQKAIAVFGSEVIGIMTAVLTLASIIFAEVLPKGLGSHYAPAVSRVAAPFILALVYVLFPLVFLLEKLVNLFKSGERVIGT
ncbi:MAG: hypothetical protein JWM56_1050, partial [Candidatus Peribacteria bacterium]|nr:hypothetical protein [Candidatus Peribacteria bacterium]